MSEHTGNESGGTPFAPPAGRRLEPDAGRAADPHPPAAASPYAPPAAPPSTPYGAPTPYASGPGTAPFPSPPHGQPGAYAPPAGYAAPAGYGQPAPAAAYSPPAPAGDAPPGTYGAQPPGAPPASGGPPSYAAPAPYGVPFGYGAPITPPTEGLATASLATSVGGLLVLGGLPGPVGVGLGIAALRRIRRRGTKGRGMAIAGVVVGAVSTLVFGGLVWLAVWAWSNPDVTGLTLDDELPDYTLRSDLEVGDCLREYPGSYDLGSADPVDCSEPHALEIVSVLPMTSPIDSYAEPPDPGYAEGFTQCAARIERSAPGLVDEWVVWTDVSYPHPDDWESGAQTAYCAVATELPDLRGSVLDGTVTGP
ncbi:DUF4190 domain-containing protein [Cellulomonas fimi]|uniref:DUF4190 domain-containing protein n=1 Tax=Cellulomonas fimi (strain ATCC 484 / DSM 20113 / JCM 1341 / CCUG 24087 / LMG 16345 / NBRC 15513 / NCIMB 8980 / NCTC 7547 / NRS-133) TaxID=590998 RepID=F4H255_CELFA|nr:DUF4190 domain-containing protein [Cellulomonas fimi]AEE46352.1 hypothetical protein Celf_2224 [Cellulomonas fimi ATCC 484]NNH07152.1 DUF4190 domain-containing protein [Cellulomonas fimi]VEH32639.1 Uncharacterised protein [Cellulomonas fimi]